ncbi:uncharacterized protein G2W53_040376 [Senna tora]|uniref:Uncharacterized protein n=1 Tax=Senna tora TaxID=362788 RepID=A0A834SC95_9FABA|nr:uncharacterized protein G2W53_040376 [Senna tora]
MTFIIYIVVFGTIFFTLSSSSIFQALESLPSPIINATVAQRRRRTSYCRSSTQLHLLPPVINAAAPAARRSSSVTVIAGRPDSFSLFNVCSSWTLQMLRGGKICFDRALQATLG